MKVNKTLVGIVAVAGLTIGTLSVPGTCETMSVDEDAGWEYGIDTYDYYGSTALTGTVPGVLYTSKVAVITNASSETAELEVDLYYSSSFDGKYQYSPDEGAHWIWILDESGNPADTWTKYVQAGDSIWLRAWILNSDGNPFHVLSPSPWGEAKDGEPYYEDYYFAYPPGAHYYGPGFCRDIAGFVAVIVE